MRLRTRITATISLAATCLVAAAGIALFALAHESLLAQPRLAAVLAYCGLGIIVLGSIGGWILASRLAAPMERWMAAADRIGVGDLHVEFPAADGSYEVRRLSAALKSMTQRLAEKEDALQARIAERTSQLEEATRALETQRERLAFALEGSRLALFDLDAQTGRVLLSKEWARMVGAPEGETVTTAAAQGEGRWVLLRGNGRGHDPLLTAGRRFR